MKKQKRINYLTPKELAGLLGVSRQTIYNWINRRKIKAKKTEKEYYQIPLSEVVKILKSFNLLSFKSGVKKQRSSSKDIAKHISEQMRFFSTPELARLLGVFHTTIKRWIESGKIKGIRIGRNYKIPVGEVIFLLKKFGVPIPGYIKETYFDLFIKQNESPAVTDTSEGKRLDKLEKRILKLEILLKTKGCITSKDLM